MKQLGLVVPDWICVDSVPFSSARKWSGASFANIGTFVIGAAEFVMRDRFEPLREKVEQYSSQRAARIVLLAYSQTLFRIRGSLRSSPLWLCSC